MALGRILLTFSLLMLSVGACRAEGEPVFFLAKDYQTALVVFDRSTGTEINIDPSLAARRLPPCSTFKIYNTLIGLELGLLKNPDEPWYHWDGVKRSVAAWNADLNLREAFAVSAVPAFRALARQIGMSRMQDYIRQLGYGSGDISSGVDSFWLPSKDTKPLLIGAQEQVALLNRLLSGEMPFSAKNIAILKDIMRLGTADNGAVLYGKTGSGTDPLSGQALGWFVGFLENGERVTVFACNVTGVDPEISGKTARTVVEQELESRGLWSNAWVSDARQQALEGDNRFALELYARYRERAGNIFYSPASILPVLAMVYEGAAGDTARQLREACHFIADPFLRLETSRFIRLSSSGGGQGYVLDAANALWASQQSPLLSSYVTLAGEFYGAGAFNLDFASDPGLSRKTINLWAEKETRGQIRDLIPEGFITPLTRLILTNAVYFKGDWLYPFDARLTRNESFTLDDNKTLSVPMMFLEGSDTARLNYAQLPEGQILELPYAGGKLSMLVFLPAPGSARAFETGLSPEKLAQWKQSLALEKVDVYLPRFVFSFSDKMREVLQAMGITDAFGPQADFSRMTGQKDIFIGEVIHKAFIEVNEQGTKAAAATAVGMFGGSMPRPAQLFRADRPFMFLIQEADTGRIIFMGRLSRP